MRSVLLIAAWIVFGGMVYGPDLGRGFVKDDFTWIRTARAVVSHPARLIVPDEPGFYRPVVTATFVFDYVRHGLDPRGYGWTNLTLYVLCVIAIAGLAAALGAGWPGSVLAAFLWAINPHGVNMAMIWLSGRTSLCLTLFSVLSATAFLTRRHIIAATLLLLALASKEEAIALPFIFFAWAWIRRHEEPVSWKRAAAMLTPLALYIALRSFTPAFTPATAPSFYQFAFDASRVARNIAEYADRSTTVVAVVVLIGAAIARRRPALGPNERRILAMMGVWWAGMLAVTVWLPVRSSLYAVCPSVASAIAGAVVLNAMRKPSRSFALEFVAAALVLMAIPLYRARNDPWVEGARVSARTLAVIRADSPTLPDRGVVLLDDEPNTVSNFHNAFGDLLTEALQTTFDRHWIGHIDAHADGTIAEYRLVRGRVERVYR